MIHSTTVALFCAAMLICSDAAAEAKVSNSVLDTDHDAVGVVASMSSACTGTLVASRRVLTAAHCVVPPASPPQLFLVGDDYNTADQVISVTSFDVDPAYNDATRERDFALLTLASTPVGIVPVPLLDPADDALQENDSLTLVGYGLTGVGASNTVRHRGLATVDQLTSNLIVTDGPAQGCNGDGGAPLLLDVDGTGYIAGIMVETDAACPDNTLTVHARISSAFESYLEPALSGRVFADGFE